MNLPLMRIHSRHGLSLVLASGILTAAGALTAVAGPEGTRVAHGTAEITRNGNETLITTSRRAILNHTQFNIGTVETVRFLQPDSASRVLNRITGSRPTLIEGAVQSNGKLYFVNPHGIHFAGSAMVDVGGLYAAAGQISDDNFLNGVDRFTNLSGAVINDGTINGQQVHMMGRQVVNNGTISVPGGLLTMVAGDNVYLAQSGERISVQIDSSNMSADTGVENNGTLSAPRGRIVLGAGDMYSLAIRNRGLISARGGDVHLSAPGGAIENSGTISASDRGAAGRVMVEAARIEQSGRIEADSTTATGGNVRLLAQQQLILAPGSDLSATGATTGGFIEVCGHELQIAGVFALEGGVADGALLIDPAQIIVDGALAATLAGTSGAITLAADDSILIQAPLALTHNNDLTLTTTTGLISFEADVTGARNLVVNAGSGIAFDASGGLFVATSRRQVYNAPIVLWSSAALQATGVTFGSTVDGAPITLEGGPNSLLVDASADFRAPVGATNPLGTLRVAGTTNIAIDPELSAYSIRTTGNQYYEGNVNLQDHTRLKATAVEFHKEVEDARAGTTPGQEADLFIDADALFSSRVTFTSPESLPNRLVGSVHVTGTTTIAGGLITTARGQTYEGAVTIADQDARLTSLGGDIRFLDTVDSTGGGEVEVAPGLTVDARRGNIQFGGDVGGNTPRGLLTAKAGVNYGKVITINGESITASGDIQFNPDGVEFVPDVATIAAPGGSVTIRSLGGRIVMGQNNKLTVLGDLAIYSPLRAILGDVNAFGDIDVSAPTIEFLSRSAGQVLEYDGVRRPDSGVDVVAQGVFRFDGDVIASGSDAKPRFGSPSTHADALGALGAFEVVQIAPLTTQNFFYVPPEAEPIVLDLRIVPLSPNADLARAMFRGPIPFADRMVRRPLLGPEGQARLQRLAIETRELTPEERQRLLARTELFSDMMGLFSAQASEATVRAVALNRVDRNSALTALDEYEALFLVQSVDPATGQRVIADQSPQIRSALAEAWAGYRQQATEASAAGFAAYLAALPADAAARVHAQRLSALMSVVDSVGLSDLELGVAARAVLEPVVPQGMTTEMLRLVIAQVPTHAAPPTTS